MPYRTTEELYELISDKMSESDFKEEIIKRREEYSDLFDDVAIAHIIVDELGQLPTSTSIADLKDKDTVTIALTILALNPVRTFQRKKGGEGRVANVNVTDGKDTCRITLWDTDTDLVSEGILKEGMKIRIINGRVKVSQYGVEINKGRWTGLVCEQAD